MRYAIHYTPSPNDPMTFAAASWLGRDVYSGHSVEPPPHVGLGMQEMSYFTALPRRYGFHAAIKAPFRLAEGASEAALLRDLMCFASSHKPFTLPRLEIARLGNSYGLVPSYPSETLNFLAASLVQDFDPYRAPLSEADIERADPDRLSAAQLTNLHRWGSPYVMDEFRFHMVLTGAIMPMEGPRVEKALRSVFDPLLDRPLEFANLALFVEEEPGAPFRVHSLHPMGRVTARKTPQRKSAVIEYHL